MTPRVLLFPGQANHDHGRLQTALDRSTGAADIVTMINEVSEDFAKSPFVGTNQLAADSPEHTSFALFALSLARFQDLARADSPTLLGHSFGQLIALTAAGAFAIEDAARLLFHYNAAIAALPTDRTGMACIGLAAPQALRFVRGLGGLVVACHNSPEQTAVAGPLDSLTKLRRRAAEHGVLYIKLASPHAFHTPAVRHAAEQMVEAARHIRQRPLRHRVFSATAGRFCTDRDDHVAELAHDLIRPVRFLEAVHALRADGARSFVECGPGRILTRLVQEIVPGITVETVESSRRAR